MNLNKAYHEHCSSCNTDINRRLKKFCLDHPEEEPASEIKAYFKGIAYKQTMNEARAFEIYYNELDSFLTENNY